MHWKLRDKQTKLFHEKQTATNFLHLLLQSAERWSSNRDIAYAKSIVLSNSSALNIT